MSRLEWAGVWLRIASDHVFKARTARAQYANDPSPALDADFDASLVAIAASAFAMEAARKERGLSKADGLKALSDAGVDIEQVGLVFARRDRSVHPEADWVPLAPHPVGTRTSPELA